MLIQEKHTEFVTHVNLKFMQPLDTVTCCNPESKDEKKESELGTLIKVVSRGSQIFEQEANRNCPANFMHVDQENQMVND